MRRCAAALVEFALPRDNGGQTWGVILSDRKYRQHGYQDQNETPKQKTGAAPAKKKDDTFGPRKLQMPGTHRVSRCAQCGAVLPATDELQACPKCGIALHSCRQCTYFDTSKRFECMQPIAERIARKDEKNNCNFFSISVRLEKETSTPAPPASKPSDARQAFENLFKKI